MFVFLKIQYKDAGTTKTKYILIVTYNANTCYKYIWNEVRNMYKTECCGDKCVHSNMILYKYAFDIALEGKYIKDTIRYWKLIHSKPNTQSTNCNCNG